MMSISSDDISRVANYAHIQLSELETQTLAEQLQQNLDGLKPLVELDTSTSEPMMNPHDAKQILRSDLVTHNQPREELLSNAPLAEKGLFLVPRVIE